MRNLAFGKLCPQRKPECGSLARVNKPPRSMSSTPIFTLPPEVRAYIFAYLLDEVEIVFKFSKAFDRSTSYARWQSGKKLAFLEACKLFKAEALHLVQFHAITIELEALSEPKTTTSPNAPAERTRYAFWRQSEIPLPFEKIRPHVRQLTIDARYALYHFLKTDMLSSFPKLRSIRIKQVLWSRMPSDFRNDLDEKSRRQALMLESLDENLGRSSGPFSPRRAVPCRTSHPPLIDLLRNPKLQVWLPLPIDLCIETDPTGRQLLFGTGDEPYTFPVERQVSTVRMTYSWPSREIIDLEADMYDQCMPLAIKSKYTEKINLKAQNETVEEVISISDGLVTPG